MDKNALRARLRSLANTRKKVRLTRPHPSQPLHNGFVLGVGRDWVLVREFHDFYPEGCTALRLRDIVGLRSGRYERLWERMLAAEGMLDHVGLPYEVPLGDLATLLRALRRRGEFVILECEDRDADVEDYYVGRVLAVGRDSVRFAPFDPLGRWEERAHVIPLSEVTQVQFDAPYSNTFAKYLRGSAPPSGAAKGARGRRPRVPVRARGA